MQSNPNTTGFRSFLRAFAGNWFTAMSGGLSVPLAFLSLYVSNGYQRTGWGILAVAGLVTASYGIWSDRVRELALTTRELEAERANNTHPILRGNIETLYVSINKDLDSTPRKTSDVQLYVK